MFWKVLIRDDEILIPIPVNFLCIFPFPFNSAKQMLKEFFFFFSVQELEPYEVLKLRMTLLLLGRKDGGWIDLEFGMDMYTWLYLF